MYRCVIPLALAASCVVAHAQTHRFFPAHTLRGELVITQFPDARMNGKPVRLAPGSRRCRGDVPIKISIQHQCFKPCGKHLAER